MTDSELLQLAAKAAGYRFSRPADDVGLWCKKVPNKCYGYWNPLTDDGDALRLAVMLGTSIEFCFLTGCVAVENCSVVAHDDPYAATRRAIVMAAAEIGKQL